MIAILLGSHGEFAKSAVESVEMIIGKQENVAVFSLLETMDLQGTIEMAQQAFDSLDRSEGTLILTDIMGGTPANVATILKRKHEEVYLLTGFNMPLLIEALLNREKDLSELVKSLKQLFPNSLIEVN